MAEDIGQRMVYVKWRIEVDGFSEDDHLNIDIARGPYWIFFLAMVLRRNDFQFLRARLLRWSPTGQPGHFGSTILFSVILTSPLLPIRKCLALVILSNDCFWLENRFSLFFLRIDINTTTQEGLMSSFRVTFGQRFLLLSKVLLGCRKAKAGRLLHSIGSTHAVRMVHFTFPDTRSNEISTKLTRKVENS